MIGPNPLNALILKIFRSPFFGRIPGPGHLQASGVSLGRILGGGASIDPFWGGEGGVLARGMYSTPAPQLNARPPMEQDEGHLPPQARRGRTPGGERPMGTPAYGAKGVRGRARGSERPIGAARCRQLHNRA